MAIRFHCPACRAELEVATPRPSLRCPACLQAVTMPGADTDAMELHEPPPDDDIVLVASDDIILVARDDNRRFRPLAYALVFLVFAGIAASLSETGIREFAGHILGAVVIGAVVTGQKEGRGCITGLIGAALALFALMVLLAGVCLYVLTATSPK